MDKTTDQCYPLLLTDLLLSTKSALPPHQLNAGFAEALHWDRFLHEY